jgi:hypothetical protein
MGRMQRRLRGGISIGLMWFLSACGGNGSPSTDGSSGSGAVGTGGATTSGGTNGPGTSGNGSGGQGTGGQGNGGQASGGKAGGGQGGGGKAGAGQGGSGNPQPMNEVFSECRLHFGTIDAKAKEQPGLIAELDFFTPGWMGLGDTFDQNYVCEDVKPGGPLEKLVPVVVAYVSAFYVKRHHGNLCDCNVTTCGQTDGRPNDLCNFGAQYIKQDLPQIIEVYRNYAKGYAACLGTTRPIVFEMEPDWYQYTGGSQVSPMSRSEAADIIEQYVAAIKESLPNAYFSLDISPWVDDNGASNGRDWYSQFDLSLFTFINTSGGSTLGANTLIRQDNQMTWAGVSGVTGRGILADTGYGAAGVSEGHDQHWDAVENLNARIADGVLGISQYNPKSDWASTIRSIRGQLAQPKFCP